MTETVSSAFKSADGVIKRLKTKSLTASVSVGVDTKQLPHSGCHLVLRRTLTEFTLNLSDSVYGPFVCGHDKGLIFLNDLSGKACFHRDARSLSFNGGEGLNQVAWPFKIYRIYNFLMTSFSIFYISIFGITIIF